jgi:hypothetical protein
MSLQTRSATDLGVALAEAITAGDAHRARALFCTPVDFRAVTPARSWEAETPVDLVDDVMLGTWFNPGRTPRELLEVSTDELADRCRVSYRIRVDGADGTTVVEQTAYYSVTDGRISWMRLVCSGFRPVNGG